MTKTWILAGDDARVSHLVEIARGLGEPVVICATGDSSVAEQLTTAGADQVVWLSAAGEHPVEAYAAAVAQAAAEDGARLILAASRDTERALAGTVAASLKAPVLTMPKDISLEDGKLAVRHGILGGIADASLKIDGPAVVVADGGGAADSGNRAPIVERVVDLSAAVTIEETIPAVKAAVDLGKAQRIVAVGRGLKSQADLALAEALAAALDAEIACSRPLAEGLGWLSNDRYIGVTGQHVAPELYVALGISGQLQHVVGARNATTVVVVNNDPNAPYFAEADYGIVGDLYAVVPALTKQAQGS